MPENDAKKVMEEDVPDPGAVSMLDQEPSALDQQPQQAMQQQPFPAQPIKVDYAPSNIDEIEELVESVINEKWRSLVENFGNIGLWKDKVRTEISSIKQELRRLETRFDNLQKAILGKITSYDENIKDVGSEIRALEKVFQKIIEPLTSNIKDLDRITKKLKEK